MQDALSKTIPIWATVLNRALAKHKHASAMASGPGAVGPKLASSGVLSVSEEESAPVAPTSWDTELHLPAWLPESERQQITCHLDGWVQQLQQLQVHPGSE